MANPRPFLECHMRSGSARTHTPLHKRKRRKRREAQYYLLSWATASVRRRASQDFRRLPALALKGDVRKFIVKYEKMPMRAAMDSKCLLVQHNEI